MEKQIGTQTPKSKAMCLMTSGTVKVKVSCDPEEGHLPLPGVKLNQAVPGYLEYAHILCIVVSFQKQIHNAITCRSRCNEVSIKIWFFLPNRMKRRCLAVTAILDLDTNPLLIRWTKKWFSAKKPHMPRNLQPPSSKSQIVYSLFVPMRNRTVCMFVNKYVLCT